MFTRWVYAAATAAVTLVLRSIHASAAFLRETQLGSLPLRGMVKSSIQKTAATAAVLTSFICSLTNVAAAPFFMGLGDLPGGGVETYANSVSADGSVVVGSSRSAASGAGFEAFRWTASGGMIGLGDLSGGSFNSLGFGVSGTGDVVVGSSNSGSGIQAFRWTAGGGMVGLGDLPGGSFQSQAPGASGDGSVVVGQGRSGSGNEAFRWTMSGGMQGLGDLPGGSFDSSAFRVSADGSVVVGQGTSSAGTEAFRWTAGGGMQGLGDLSGGIFYSEARGLSADGSVVVGFGSSNLGTEAFRWTAGGGMVGLGDLPGGSFNSLAFGVSGDGGVVVGRSATAAGDAAFVWEESNGMRKLQNVLSSSGLDTSGWTLNSANAVSADGKVIIGNGINPTGQAEAWIANLRVDTPQQPTLTLADVLTNSVKLSTLDAWDVFKNQYALASRYPSYFNDANHFNGTLLTSGIGAEFTPGHGLTLSQAAALGGYDHFNWFQVFFDPPNSDQPSIDPTLGCYKPFEQFTGNPCPNRDNLPWYLDEQFTIDGIRVYNEVGFRVTSDGSLKTRREAWTASPTTLLFSDQPDGALRFLTCLAGVRADGTGDVLSFPSTCFTWESADTDGPFATEGLGGASIIAFNEFVSASSFTIPERTLMSFYDIGLVQANEPPINILFLVCVIAIIGSVAVRSRSISSML